MYLVHCTDMPSQTGQISRERERERGGGRKRERRGRGRGEGENGGRGTLVNTLPSSRH